MKDALVVLRNTIHKILSMRQKPQRVPRCAASYRGDLCTALISDLKAARETSCDVALSLRAAFLKVQGS